MTGPTKLGFSQVSASSLREKAAKITLQRVRAQGHKYVELREDGKNGKRFIFFCTLCLSPCYSEGTLSEHLKGNFHKERYAAAKYTLLGRNPWPFNDGVVFFHDSSEENGHLADAHEENMKVDGGKDELLVPKVLSNDVITDIELKLIGLGEIGVRIVGDEDDVQKTIKRMWCAWLGKENSEAVYKASEHDFGIVVFSYNYNLGRKSIFDDCNLLLDGNNVLDMEIIEGRKRKRSFSDPGDVSESLSTQYESSGEDSLNSNSPSLDCASDQGMNIRKLVPSKSLRRALRLKQQLAADKMCDICQNKMLPGKDVATLLNMKTGRLACSSRNVNGAFHVFHVSCLVHWILLCEFEIQTKQVIMPKEMPKPKRKTRAKSKKNRNGIETRVGQDHITSVFCPECQGTGVDIKGDDQLEKPRFLLSEMFNHKINVSDARKAWIKSPEILPNCSIGFHFPSQSEETLEEIVQSQKLLRFHRAGV